MQLTINQFEVLTTIEENEKKLSQRDIAKETKLSLGTINKVISELLENKLIDEDAVISPVYYTDKNSFVQNYVKGMQFPSFGSKYEFKWAYIQGK